MNSCKSVKAGIKAEEKRCSESIEDPGFLSGKYDPITGKDKYSDSNDKDADTSLYRW